MNFQKYLKKSFVIIGKEGSTNEGDGFVKKLWDNANSHFNEIAHLSKKDEKGNLMGIWGAMSDFSHSFLPWEDNFSKGLYLAGIEAIDDAEPPVGWTKWTLPSFEYLCILNDHPSLFNEVIAYLKENKIPLIGAAQEFNNPTTQQAYLYFPIQKLNK